MRPADVAVVAVLDVAPPAVPDSRHLGHPREDFQPGSG
jgi:hypothetical protein